MAYPFTLDTPERVLKRVEAMEEMELPSLPSFQHDGMDFDTGTMTEAESSRDDFRSPAQSEKLTARYGVTTPHPMRRTLSGMSNATVVQGNQSPADSSSLSSSSPYPPVRSPTEQGTPSPYLPGKAATSTPQSQATSRSKRYASENETRSTVLYAGGRFERGRSVTDSAVGDSTTRTAKRWHTPGEMSASFSGEEIPVDGEQSVNFGSDMSLPVPEEQRSGILSEVSQSSMNIAPTPITHRLSTSRNVVLQRPGRRSQSLAKQAVSMPATPGGVHSPIAESEAVPSPATPEGLPAQDRVPSLSRSQMTHSSGGARTPESQPPAMRSTTPESPSPDILPEPSRDDLPSQIPEEQTASYAAEAATHSDIQVEHEPPSVSYAPAESPERSIEPLSPVQSFHTPSGMSEYPTPGVARGSGSPMQENLMASNPFNRMRESTPMTALQDISQNRQSFAYTPYTPSPLGMTSKNSDFSTPRAPLDDAERRKSHVLAVLSSTGLPSRVTRPLRGTPHPVRRGLALPGSESIAEEEGTPTSFRHTSAEFGSRSQLTVASFQDDQSFVSVASSADLTSDKRASRHPVARGNTSFPTILLPTSGDGSSSAMRSLHGSEGRADGVKIHKHLNAMNKQLLETNGELAREAEAWRSEVDRLRGMLVDAGVEVEDMDILARLADRSRSPGTSSRSGSLGPPPSLGDLSRHSLSARQALADRRRSGSSTASASRMERLDEVGQDEQIAIMQEMADKLEMLEQGLDEKDQLIADLEARLEAEPASDGLREEVDRLRTALEQGEKARNDLHAEFAHKTEQHAKQFGEICSGFETQVKALEADLANSKAELDQLREEKGRLEGVALAGSQSEKEAQLRKHVAQLEEELSLLRQDARQAEQELSTLRQASQQEKEELGRAADEAKDKATRLQTQLEELQDRFEELTKASDDLHVQLDDAQGARRSAEEEHAILQREVEEFGKVKTFLEEEPAETREKVDALTTRLEEVDARGNETTEADDLRRDIEDLEGKLAEQDAELEVLRGKLAVADMSFLAPRTPGQAPRDAVSASSAADQTSFVAALEDRLDDAYREIGRLKHELASTPRHQSTLEARDAKIKALEAEKASLKARLNSLKQSQSRSQSFLGGGNSTVLQAATSPFGRPTPLAHRAIAALKTPKTPGPMKDLSWLNTTVGDAAEPVLRAQVDYLQDELKRANDQLDQNFSRLEEAGFGGVRLAEKLAKAEERILELEDEIRALSQRNKASLALVSLNKKGTMLADGDRAKKTMDELHGQIDELKADMKAEKARLQKENKRLQDLLFDLQVTNDAQIDRLRVEMAQLVDDLEAERRKAKSGISAAVKGKERLEQDVAKSSARVQELERNLSEQRERYEQLTRRFDEAAQQATSRVEVARQSSTIRSLEADLREARSSADDLRAQLHRQSMAQRQAEARVAELEREKKRIAENLDAFERDFLIQEEEVQKLGEQLRLLGTQKQGSTSGEEAVRAQLEKVLRSTKQKLQAAQRDLEAERARCDELQRQASRTASTDGRTATALADQKSRFKTQAKEMATQIQYLKAKFTRESTFRNALALQKRYLLVLVGGMSLNEQATLKAIASMGFPVPTAPKPKRSFKSVAIAVLSLVRARKAAEAWRAERESKAEAVAGREERRRVSGERA